VSERRLVAWLREQIDIDEAGADADLCPPPGYFNAERQARGERALAEVEFKRKLLADFENDVTWSMDTLRDLASTVYKDRPGYAEAVKPGE
jgi:hypothetical protein